MRTQKATLLPCFLIRGIHSDFNAVDRQTGSILLYTK
jgi:hypothetical protein